MRPPKRPEREPVERPGCKVKHFRPHSAIERHRPQRMRLAREDQALRFFLGRQGEIEIDRDLAFEQFHLATPAYACPAAVINGNSSGERGLEKGCRGSRGSTGTHEADLARLAFPRRSVAAECFDLDVRSGNAELMQDLLDRSRHCRRPAKMHAARRNIRYPSADPFGREPSACSRPFFICCGKSEV